MQQGMLKWITQLNTLHIIMQWVYNRNIETRIAFQVGGSAAGQGKVELSRGDKMLRFIGWLGGFYSRKAVRETVVL